MRPKDWKNPYRPSKFVSGGPDWQKERAYEAGADAILEALRDNGTKVYKGNYHGVTFGRESLMSYAEYDGTLVFIPDE